MADPKKAQRKWRRNLDLRAARAAEARVRRRLKGRAHDLGGESRVYLLALRIEVEVLKAFGRTRRTRAELMRRFLGQSSEEERAAVAMVLHAHGVREGRTYVAWAARKHGDPSIRDACARFLRRLAEMWAQRAKDRRAPGGFIHKPVGREKGFDYP